MAWQIYKPERGGRVAVAGPTATVGIKGTLTLNRAAKELVRMPFTFIVLFDPESLNIGLRECRPADVCSRTTKNGKFNVRGLLQLMNVDMPKPGEVLDFSVSKELADDETGMAEWQMLVLKPKGARSVAKRQPRVTNSQRTAPMVYGANLPAAPLKETTEAKTEALMKEMRNHCLLRSKPVTADVLDQWANRFNLPLVSVRQLHRTLVDGQKLTGKVKEAQ